MAHQGNAGHSAAEDSAAEDSAAEHDPARQDAAGHNAAGHNAAGHNAAGHNAAGHNAAELAATKHSAGEHSATRRDTDVALSSSLMIDDQICFALYAASRSVIGVYRPLLDRLGLTYPQYLVMLVLWERGASAIKEISAALQLDYGTLTPLLKRLEAMGYILRQRRADDERAVRIVLTDGGLSLRSEATDVPIEISRALGLSAADTDTLRTLLRRVVTNTSAFAN
jgi:DNA-binding MarR family transcriptional regulator